MQQPKLLVALYWHMHQPDYRDSLTGEYVLPWTYLHAIKDYSDMAYHLEANPKARVSFNYVPVLLDQLEDYVAQFAIGKVRDPLLAMLYEENLECVTQEHCQQLIESCFKSHHEKMLAPFAEYQRLYNLYLTASQSSSNHNLEYFSTQYKADLLVWYHLAWMGESIKRNNRLVQFLMGKGSHFTLQNRRELFELIGEIMSGLIPRYKALQQKGQIEVTATPHYHPILPLLIDFHSTRDAMPHAKLPKAVGYPGGRVRARDHLRDATLSHKKRFGAAPVGMWPSEGAVSKESLLLMAEEGVQWAASGEGVLANSIRKSHPGHALVSRHDYLYQPHIVSDGKNQIVCFFRDDRLSDKIGFEYSKMHSTDAVNDFVQNLEHIYHTYHRKQNPVVSVILDGENAWEYYPYNGYYFLTELYQALANHPHIEMVTPSEVVKAMKAPEKSPYQVHGEVLPEVAAGSWVYGSFSTWIGSTDKNLGWDLLCDAKAAYDKVMKAGTMNEEERKRCELQLSVCEGSDWFWWFGDYNNAMSVSSFDLLYRRNLTNLYQLLKLPVPKALSKPISLGTQAANDENSGTMRRGQEN